MRNIIEIKQCEILPKSNNAKYYRNRSYKNKKVNLLQALEVNTRNLLLSSHKIAESVVSTASDLHVPIWPVISLPGDTITPFSLRAGASFSITVCNFL